MPGKSDDGTVASESIGPHDRVLHGPAAGNREAFHLPDPEQPDRPRCGTEAREWLDCSRERAEEKGLDVCKRCFGLTDPHRESDPKATRRTLLATDPDDVATDGGEDVYENPEELPDHHPLAWFDGSLDDHAAHLDALGEYLSDVDPDEVESVMAIVTTDEATETIPTTRPDADMEACIWFQLAAHVSHVAHTFGAEPEAVAKHACHVLRDQQPDDDPEPVADGAGVSGTALTMFQQRCLRAIRRLERQDVEKLHGLAIKEALEDDYGEEVHHGRLYPNLDQLVDWGLVEKDTIDSRTNSYALTQAGRDLLTRELQAFAGDLGLVVYDANAQARPDGGDRA